MLVAISCSCGLSRLKVKVADRLLELRPGLAGWRDGGGGPCITTNVLCLCGRPRYCRPRAANVLGLQSRSLFNDGMQLHYLELLITFTMVI